MLAKNRNGFTLLQMLACLFVLSSLCILSLNKAGFVDIQYRSFISECNYFQAKSLNEGQSEYVNEYSEYPILFSKGMVNMGQSFYVGKRKVVIRPITGYIRYE